MFIKLSKDDIYSITYIGGGKPKPQENIYINLNSITIINGNFVTTGTHVLYCSNEAVKRIEDIINNSSGIDELLINGGTSS